MLRQQPEEKSLNLQCTKNKLPNTAQITTSEKEHEKQRLTRFGLDAYVLGAMKERFNFFGRSITMDATPLSIKRAATFVVTTKP